LKRYEHEDTAYIFQYDDTSSYVSENDIVGVAQIVQYQKKLKGKKEKQLVYEMKDYSAKELIKLSNRFGK